MAKIQHDTVNGVEIVDEFDSEAVIVKGFEVDDLRTADKGLFGAEVTDEQLEEIRSEYGFFRE